MGCGGCGVAGRKGVLGRVGLGRGGGSGVGGGVRRASPMRAASDASRDFWALDFDGVCCDTEPESSLSGWRAAAQRWPQLFYNPRPDDKERVLKSMARLRPIIETGYENMVLVRLMYEEILASRARADDTGSRPLTVGEVMANWDTLLPSLLQRWDLDRTELIEYFGSVRDEWMAEDLQGWLAPNTMYPGIVDALNASPHELYIVTTKNTRFAQALLRAAGCTRFEDEGRIFGLGTGPKRETLAKLAGYADAQGKRLHFIEDRLATLDTIRAKSPDVAAQWDMLLCDWGYNTPPERQAAQDAPDVRVVTLPEFLGELKGV